MDFASHLRDVLARSTGGVVELTFHPPLPLADFADRKALAEAAADAAVGDRRPAPAGAASQPADGGSAIGAFAACGQTVMW